MEASDGLDCGQAIEGNTHEQTRISETGGGGFFGIEGGDSFDEAGYGEGVAHAALAADEVQSTALAGEGDGEFHEGRNAGAVDLWNAVQVNDQLPRTLLHEIVGEVVEMLAGLADGKPALNLKVVNAAGFARRNFKWWMKRHEYSLSSMSTAARLMGCGSVRGTGIIR